MRISNRIINFLAVVVVGLMVITINSQAEEASEKITVVDAGMNQPMGLVVVDGSIYVADTYNNQIKKISGNEVVVIAGKTDQQDIFGFPLGGLVDGSVEEAYFNRPRDLVVSSDGVIYVADTDNHVIRKIEDGQVTTLAGTGEPGFADGNGSEAMFNKPSGLAMDSQGRLIVTDMLNNKIRMVDVDGTVSTVELSSADSSHILNEPSDLVVLDTDDYMIVDSGQQVVKRISNGQVSVLSGLWDGEITEDYKEAAYLNGKNEDARYAFPKSLTVHDGLVYVADTWNHSIRVIKQDGTVDTLAGNGVAGNNTDLDLATFNGPSGLAIDDGNLYIADRYNNRIVSMALSYGSEVYDLDLEEFSDSDPNKIEILIDGEIISYVDVEPSVRDDIFYYPVRLIAESLGMVVSYKDVVREARIQSDDINVTYSIDDERGLILNNRFMMPIRELATDLEVFLSLNQDSKDVWISQPAAIK